MKRMVSLVIPIYNSDRFLRRCLDTAIAQTYDALDIVCIDDGSTDESSVILKEYAEKDKRIRVYSNVKENKGAAGARNLGLSKAMGEYVQFLDSDDFFEIDMVETLVNKAVKTDADVVICRGKAFDDELHRVVGNLPHPDLQYAPDTDCFNWKDCSEYICEIADNYAWNKLFRKKLLIDNELCFTPIKLSEDQFISMVAPVVAERVAVIDKAFVNYRIKTGSSLCDSKSEHPEGAFEGTYKVVEKFRDMGIYQAVKKSYLNVSVRLMREYFDSMTEYSKISFLYEKFRNVIFPMLEAVDLPEGYFHDKRVGEWYQMIINKNLPEILFDAARAGGGSMTTAPIRFRVPYERITKNSRIVLVGKGLIGRYWLSQLILSGYCEVVYWAEYDEQIPKDITYDEVLTAV